MKGVVADLVSGAHCKDRPTRGIERDLMHLVVP